MQRQADLLVDVAAQMRSEVFEAGDVCKILQAQVWKKLHGNLSRGVLIAQERETHRLATHPFRVPRNRRNRPLRHFLFREDLQNLAFGKKRVVQRKFDRTGVPFRQKRTRNTRRAAAGQREFLPDRQVRRARDDCLLGYPFYIGRGGRKQAHAYKIEQIKLANSCQRDSLRSARMASEAQTHGFARTPFRLARNGRFDKILGYLQTLQKQNDMRLFTMRIFENGREDFLATYKAARSLQMVDVQVFLFALLADERQAQLLTDRQMLVR